AGATDERRALRRGGRASRRPCRSRQPRSGLGRGRGRTAFVRSQARPPQLHARRRHHPSTVTSAVTPCPKDKRGANTMCSGRVYTTDTYLQPTEIYGLKPPGPGGTQLEMACATSPSLTMAREPPPFSTSEYGAARAQRRAFRKL